MVGVTTENELEIKGINDMAQLAQAESFQSMRAREYMVSDYLRTRKNRRQGSLRFQRLFFRRQCSDQR